MHDLRKPRLTTTENVGNLKFLKMFVTVCALRSFTHRNRLSPSSRINCISENYEQNVKAKWISCRHPTSRERGHVKADGHYRVSEDGEFTTHRFLQNPRNRTHVSKCEEIYRCIS